MQYREFGKLGFKVSTFGLGCMRLPLKKLADGTTNYGIIDEEKAISLIRHAVDSGVNYIDTAYTYHEETSELLLAKALKDGYREKVKIATKLPVWKVDAYEDFEKFLDEQRSKLEVEYIDFYLLHSLTKSTWSKIKALNVTEFLDKAIKSGKIKYAGFSFHDELPLFKEIVDSYPWSMCQIQYNLLDEHYQAGREGLLYAASKGIPVVIMEPLRGGNLANNVSSSIKKIWDKASVKRTPVDWAFRWICNNPEVAVVLSGVTTMEQLNEDIEIFETALPGSMTPEESSLAKEVQEYYKSRIKVGCTGCNYCSGCPSGIAISKIFDIYNHASLFETFEEDSSNYERLVKNGKDASLCIECGSCESICPQKIPIIEKLKEARQALSK